MGSCFLLRSRDGNAMGYVMSEESGIICRVQKSEHEKISVILLEESGTTTCFSMPDDGKEHRLCTSSIMLTGACVRCDGRIICATGNDVWPITDAPQPGQCPAHKKNVLRKENTFGESADSRLAQSRWPRPVCWSDAEYRDGRWQDTQEEREAIGETVCSPEQRPDGATELH